MSVSFSTYRYLLFFLNKMAKTLLFVCASLTLSNMFLLLQCPNSGKSFRILK